MRLRRRRSRRRISSDNSGASSGDGIANFCSHKMTSHYFVQRILPPTIFNAGRPWICAGRANVLPQLGHE